LIWNPLAAPEVLSYVVDNAGPDVKELLLGEKRNDVIKAALDSKVKFVPPTKKSIEIDKPILSRDGSGTNFCTTVHLSGLFCMNEPVLVGCLVDMIHISIIFRNVR
jgi:hypothetical protein